MKILCLPVGNNPQGLVCNSISNGKNRACCFTLALFLVCYLTFPAAVTHWLHWMQSTRSA